MSPSASKSDALFAQMRTDILSLDLAPGMPLRLPSLSAHYGIGLTPLRECLNRLASDQLVVAEHNKGFFVAPLTRQDLLDLERSRNAIEGALFLFSVVNGDDNWEAGVVGAYHHLERTPIPSALDDAAALAHWTRRHDRFHAALLAGSHSIWMHRFAQQVSDQLGRYQRFIQSALRDLTLRAPEIAAHAVEVFAAAMALDPHRRLYDAAMARDGQAAKSAFDAHTQLTMKAFIDLTEMMPQNTPLSTTLGPQTEVTQ